MRLSRFFLPILRENPKEADIVSHRLMLRAGMLRQEAAGIYAFLPLGFRVLKKIEQIVREEQDRAGAIELLMPTLQLADLWRESGRYDAYGPEMLRIRDRHERELLYGPTNEDMITEIFRAYVRSYRELPKILYHIQWKFRDEQRPRFGVMRGREFLMKDAYSFDIDEAAARLSYNRMFVAYLRTFARMGLKAIPMRAETGPIGGDLSHEFIILAQTGESGVFCDKDILDLPIPGEDVDYDGDLSPIIRDWTRLYAATEDVHDAARFEREVAPGPYPRHRGRPDLLFRDQILGADERRSVGPGWERAPGPWRLLRRRRVTPGSGHYRGFARRCRYHLAGRGRPVRRHHPQSQAGRRRDRRRLRAALPRSYGAGRGRALS
jgi:prolyl-tRNA synthetase